MLFCDVATRYSPGRARSTKNRFCCSMAKSDGSIALNSSPILEGVRDYSTVTVACAARVRRVRERCACERACARVNSVRVHVNVRVRVRAEVRLCVNVFVNVRMRARQRLNPRVKMRVRGRACARACGCACGRSCGGSVPHLRQRRRLASAYPGSTTGTNGSEIADRVSPHGLRLRGRIRVPAGGYTGRLWMDPMKMGQQSCPFGVVGSRIQPARLVHLHTH